MDNKIAQVVVDLPVEGPFDYEVPTEIASRLAVGGRVLVPFQTKKLIGFVVGLKATSAFKRLKPVLSALDSGPVVSPAMLKLAQDLALAYCCSLGTALATMLPAHFKRTTKQIVFALPAAPTQDKAQAPETLFVQGPSFKDLWPIVAERVHKAADEGCGVIVLVPETERIAAVVEGLKAAVPGLSVCVLDKQLSDKAQTESWVSAREGRAKIVVGTRSAVFAPVASLKLIVMIDENSFSYKQDQSPFYHARQVALLRAGHEGAQVIFAGRSPSLELYHLIRKKKAVLCEAPSAEKPCAVQLIDMSNYKHGRSRLISIPLSHAIEKTLAERGKVLLLMNKKGFGSFGVCTKCGYALKCPRCDVPLTFLYESKQVVCRYCNHRAPYSSVCPQCQGAYLNFTGMGIEKLESEVARLFPSARVFSYAKETEAVAQDFDILIATQAVTRLDARLRFNLTCVVQMDSELNRMDFQAGENAFALLTHLAAMTAEKLFIQTHVRDNFCLKALTQGQPSLFYSKELALRRELGLPPLAHMAEIVLRSTDKDAALRQAELLFGVLNEHKPKGLEVLPVQVLALARLRDQYRFVIVAKARARKALTGAIRKALAALPRASRVIATVNMNP